MSGHSSELLSLPVVEMQLIIDQAQKMHMIAGDEIDR